MASSSLLHGDVPSHTETYSIKELQLIVRDAPAIPAAILPFVGQQYHSSADVYRAFRPLAAMPTGSMKAVTGSGAP